jgi:hypothetical protein
MAIVVTFIIMAALGVAGSILVGKAQEGKPYEETGVEKEWWDAQ